MRYTPHHGQEPPAPAVGRLAGHLSIPAPGLGGSGLATRCPASSSWHPQCRGLAARAVGPSGRRMLLEGDGPPGAPGGVVPHLLGRRVQAAPGGRAMAAVAGGAIVARGPDGESRGGISHPGRRRHDGRGAGGHGHGLAGPLRHRPRRPSVRVLRADRRPRGRDLPPRPGPPGRPPAGRSDLRDPAGDRPRRGARRIRPGPREPAGLAPLRRAAGGSRWWPA